LISCPKQVSEPPKREMTLFGADWRNGAKLIASDGTDGVFSIFMRKNEDFREDFSIGLMYCPQDDPETITLLRCNGRHGDFNANIDPDHPHFNFHIHRASEEAIDAGGKPEKFASKTTEFASYEEALQYFVKAINLNSKDVEKHFPSSAQFPLFPAS
jgi:hypothetical protein